MTITPRQLERIADVYDVLLAPERCVPMLDRLAHAVDAKAAGLFAFDRHNPVVQISHLGSHYPPETVADYLARFGETELAAYQRFFAFPAREWMPDERIYDVAIEDDPAGAWMRDHFGTYRRSAARLTDSRIWIDGLALHFDHARGLITPAEQAFFRPVLPHLAKLVEVNRPFDALRRLYGAVMDALDRLQIGVAVLLASLGVVLMNREAERICALDAGVQITPDRRIVLENDLAQRRFRSAVAAAVDTAKGEGATLSDRVVVPRLHGGEPFLLDVSAVRGTDHEIDPGLRAAVVFMVDPENSRPVRIENMQALYALTSAEAEVLKLVVEGLPAQDIAETRNTAVTTVRTQLRALSDKTGAPNRAALVRLALTVNPPIETVGGPAGP